MSYADEMIDAYLGRLLDVGDADAADDPERERRRLKRQRYRRNKRRRDKLAATKHKQQQHDTAAQARRGGLAEQRNLLPVCVPGIYDGLEPPQVSTR